MVSATFTAYSGALEWGLRQETNKQAKEAQVS